MPVDVDPGPGRGAGRAARSRSRPTRGPPRPRPRSRSSWAALVATLSSPPLTASTSMPSAARDPQHLVDGVVHRVLQGDDAVAAVGRGVPAPGAGQRRGQPAAVAPARAVAAEPRLEQDDAQGGVGLLEVVRRPEAGEAAADDADVGVPVAGQGRPRRREPDAAPPERHVPVDHGREAIGPARRRLRTAATRGSRRSRRSAPVARPGPGRPPAAAARSARRPRGRSRALEHPPQVQLGAATSPGSPRTVAPQRDRSPAATRRNHAAVRRPGRVDVDDEGRAAAPDQPAQLAQPGLAARPEEVRPPGLGDVDAGVRAAAPAGPCPAAPGRWPARPSGAGPARPAAGAARPRRPARPARPAAGGGSPSRSRRRAPSRRPSRGPRPSPPRRRRPGRPRGSPARTSAGGPRCWGSAARPQAREPLPRLGFAPPPQQPRAARLGGQGRRVHQQRQQGPAAVAAGRLDDGQVGHAVLGQLVVRRVAHQLAQLALVGAEDRLPADVGLGVAAAVPVEVVAARPPAAPVVLRDRGLQVASCRPGA